MNGKNLEVKNRAGTNSSTSNTDSIRETLEELAKLQMKAADEQNYNLCKVIQIEIQRCLHQKPLLIPAGQVDGLILDPLLVLLGK